MKSIQSLAEHLEQWQRVWFKYTRQKLSSHGEPIGADNPQKSQEMDQLPSKTRYRLGKAKEKSPRSRKGRSPLSLVVAVVCLTGAIGNRFWDQPQLNVGTIAPRTIYAPSSARILDEKTTEEDREKARIGSISLLKIDSQVNAEIEKDLQRALASGDRLREIAGPLPFADTSILSQETQLYARQARPWEWLAIMTAAKNDAIALPTPSSSNSSKLPWGGWAVKNRLLTESGLQAVRELQAYRLKTENKNLDPILERIEQARSDYFQTIQELLAQSESNSESFYGFGFLKMSDLEWQEAKKGIRFSADSILTQGIPPGLPKTNIENAVRKQVRAAVPESAWSLAREILLDVLEPNLEKDQEATRLRAQQAAEAVETVYATIEAGEAIVQKQEKISQANFVLLDHFGLSKRGTNWDGLFGLGVAVSIAVAIFWLVERNASSTLRRRDRLLVLLLTLTAPLSIVLGMPIASLPAIGLLLGSYYGSSLGATVITLLAILLPIGMEIELAYLLGSATGGLIGGIAAAKMRSREELALLGVCVGLGQGIIYLIATLIISANAGSVWYGLLGAAALQGLGGLAWSIVALGLSPYLEHLFDLIVPIRLAELSNPNRPLLKRLGTEAPGTFQHTLFVASLAEAAAKELGCNVELVRAGTLYHDIGKMHDPLGFIENQMGGPNKHDLIDDPWQSVEIIKKHVTQGLVMAKKHRLPKAIQAFIPEHQGTMLVAYFYHQAQQQAIAKGLAPVPESDFRYDGPIPQSRETGIVMLADSCEAALRSLKDVTPEEALNMVNKILRARWQDGQLVDSCLKREDMPKIAAIFVRIWQQYNHKRIAYPKAALQPKNS